MIRALSQSAVTPNPGSPTAVVACPAGVEVDDLLLMFVIFSSETWDLTDPKDATVSCSGFTPVCSAKADYPVNPRRWTRLTVLSKVVTGSEPASYTVNAPFASHQYALSGVFHVSVVAYRGATSVQSFVTEASAAASPTSKSPAVTTASEDSHVVQAVMSYAVTWMGPFNFDLSGRHHGVSGRYGGSGGGGSQPIAWPYGMLTVVNTDVPMPNTVPEIQSSAWWNHSLGATLVLVSTSNHAPNAAVHTKPYAGARADFGTAAGRTFEWSFNDPDSGDVQSAWAFAKREVGQSTWLYWTGSDWSSSSSSSKQTGGDQSATFASGFDNGKTYEWMVKTWDALDAAGPWSTPTPVQGDTAPVVSAVAIDPADMSSGDVKVPMPTLVWTYSDAEGDPQDGYEVRVFDVAVVGANPDPGSSVPYWQSGVIDANSTSHVVGSSPGGGSAVGSPYLADDEDYLFFVRVRHAGGLWSDWGSVGEHTTFAKPDTPTLAPTAEPSVGRVKLVVTVPQTSPAAEVVLIERSEDAGVTWAEVRSAARAPASDASLTFYDYEFVSATNLAYRCRTGRAVGSQYVYSTAHQPAALKCTLTSAWFKNPADPSRNLALRISPEFTRTRPLDSDAFYPIGRGRAVVVRSANPPGEELRGVRVWALSAADQAAIGALVDSGDVLLLQDVLPRKWYVSPVDGVEWRRVHAAPVSGEYSPVRDAYECVLSLVEVDAP